MDMRMKRRFVIQLGLGFTLAPLRARAQASRAAQVGVLANYPATDPRQANGWEGWPGFIDEMKRLGWEEGRNLTIQRRYGMADPETFAAAAKELVALRVDVIYAPGDMAAAAARQATESLPIVMHGVAAVEFGYAQSLARPGGNVTGAVYQGLDFTGKEFGLLKALRPDLKKIGISTSLGNRLTDLKFFDWRSVAGRQGVEVVQLPDTPSAGDIGALLSAARREAVQAMVIRIRPQLRGAPLQQINTWAVENRVLTYAGNWARREVMVSYGPVIADITRAAIGKIDLILRGSAPADLPIEQPTRFELVINVRSVRAMGLSIPEPVLLSATELVE
jgi:putative ABC transport system substrate-binding protein